MSFRFTIGGELMKYGLIGERLGHSFSADVHSKMGKDYRLTELSVAEFDDFFSKKDFYGINVTIPYKQRVMNHLDVVDKRAEMIGAVNTVVNKNGALYGYNTDFDGLLNLISKYFTDLSGKKALILGDGGTSKTAYSVLKSLNAKKIYVVSRHPKENQISYLDAVNLHKDANILVNTTPVGMYPSVNGRAINLENFNSLDLVIDAVYNPLRSDLVLSAENKGVSAEGGLYMLIAQAVAAAEHFDNIKYERKIIEDIYRQILSDKQNIVLTGMPGSGKSTIGKLLAELFGREFVDTDTLFTEKMGCKIADFFSKYGENEFRRVESEIVAEISLNNGLVIATGGGVVLNKENIRHLKHNGIIFYLNRNVKDLVPTEDRPLARSREDIINIYNARKDIYNLTSDFSVTVTNPEDTAKEIIKIFKGLDV